MTGSAGSDRALNKKRVGLLLVHGIGDQQPGDFLSDLLPGFRMLFGAERVAGIDRQDPLGPGITADRAPRSASRTSFAYLSTVILGR